MMLETLKWTERETALSAAPSAQGHAMNGSGVYRDTGKVCKRCRICPVECFGVCLDCATDIVLQYGVEELWAWSAARGRG